MKTVSFIAESPTAALAQVHAALGPDAVVLSVRPAPAQGVARLLPGRRRIEVVAGLPEAELDLPASTRPNGFSATLPAARSVSHWRSVAWLEAMGFLPAFAEQLQLQVNTLHATPPDSVEAEWAAVHATLTSAWRAAPPLEDAGRPVRPHVLVGPPGSGKSTALCKWLTLAVLTQDRRARVWRLDTAVANTTEMLSLHAEMLGVPVERFWAGSDEHADLLFVDLPGVDMEDAVGMTALRNQLAGLPAPRVHLVLNAAYETDALLAQWHAFEPLQPEDVILTHLDEERRRIKLWNLVWGTNCTVRFLSSGSKIPGQFELAGSALLWPSRS